MLCRCGLLSQKGGLKEVGEKVLCAFDVGIKVSYLMVIWIIVKIVFNNQCLIIPTDVVKTNAFQWTLSERMVTQINTTKNHVIQNNATKNSMLETEN